MPKREEVDELGAENTVIVFPTITNTTTGKSYLIMKGTDRLRVEFPVLSLRCSLDAFDLLFASITSKRPQQKSMDVFIGKVRCADVRHLAFQGALGQSRTLDYFSAAGFLLVPLNGAATETRAYESYLRDAFFGDAYSNAYRVVDAILSNRPRFFAHSNVTKSLLPSILAGKK